MSRQSITTGSLHDELSQSKSHEVDLPAAQESADGIVGSGNEPEHRRSHLTEGLNGSP